MYLIESISNTEQLVIAEFVNITIIYSLSIHYCRYSCIQVYTLNTETSKMCRILWVVSILTLRHHEAGCIIISIWNKYQTLIEKKKSMQDLITTKWQSQHAKQSVPGPKPCKHNRVLCVWYPSSQHSCSLCSGGFP